MDESAGDCAACRGVTRMAKTSGCALSGFVPVKKVPGADESAADCAARRGVTRTAKTSGCALSGFVRAHVSQQLTVLRAGA